MGGFESSEERQHIAKKRPPHGTWSKRVSLVSQFANIIQLIYSPQNPSTTTLLPIKIATIEPNRSIGSIFMNLTIFSSFFLQLFVAGFEGLRELKVPHTTSLLSQNNIPGQYSVRLSYNFYNYIYAYGELSSSGNWLVRNCNE